MSTDTDLHFSRDDLLTANDVADTDPDADE